MSLLFYLIEKNEGENWIEVNQDFLFAGKQTNKQKLLGGAKKFHYLSNEGCIKTAHPIFLPNF